MIPEQDVMLEKLQLAVGHHQSGDLAQAERLYREILAADPDNPDALHLLGVIALQLGRNEGAAELIERAHRNQRPSPMSLNNLGKAYLGLQRSRDAKRCFAKALALKPDSAETHQNLGVALTRLGQAKEAEASFRRALALEPGNADAHYNRAQLLIDLARFDEAEQCYRRALAAKPDFAEAHHNLGIVLSSMGRLEEARQSIGRALEISPDYSDARQNLIMLLDFTEEADTKRQQDERRLWYARFAKSHGESIRAHANRPDPDRRLRIGYVSPDFRAHSASYVFGPMIRHHDNSRFEVICYSDVKREDEVTRRFREAASEWRATLGAPDEALAEAIRGDGIDILVDLCGHSEGNRLPVFARKPAPVQVTAWGYATGTGLPTIDYFFADPVLVPQEERQFFDEEVIDLPCCVCYEAPGYSPQVSPLPSLGGAPFTFGCFNRIEKVSDRVISLWARILASAPDSRILVKEQKLDDPAIRARLLERLKRFGIEPEHLWLQGKSSHAEHLRAHAAVDLALDPYPHGGGVSTLEALWMGVPVVTLMGSTIPSRLSASILTALDMRDWIARGDDEYVQKALDAARNPRGLAQVREELRPRMAASILGDVQAYTRAVEETYRSLWRRWCEKAGRSGG